nr:hypothetical protein [uncultured bacterium]
MPINPATGTLQQQSPIIKKAATFTRPADTTQYAAGDAVAPATVAISGATNASPIVVTTSAPHLLNNDDRVFIAGVVGNTNANGIRKVKVLTSTTFSLLNEKTGAAIAGNAAYVSGGTVQPILRLDSVVPTPGGSGGIVAVRLQVKNGTVTLGTFRVRIFSRPVNQIADNAAFTLLDANRDYRQGYIDLTILTTDGAGSDSSEVNVQLAQPLPFVCESDRTDLFIQITALGAFTPSSGETYRVELTIRRNEVASAFKVAGS